MGIGFRLSIGKWTVANLSKFDALEITVDHYIKGGEAARNALRNLVGKIPLVGHGVGLSIGTDTPLNEQYLDDVVETVEALQLPNYSEHLAWTKVPGIDLANLLPVPRTREVADDIIAKVKVIQERIPVPFALENISYVFDWPDSNLTDAEFFNIILQETGVGVLLDVENLHINSMNYGFDPFEFLDQLPPNVVHGMHVAGGPSLERTYLDEPFWADTHSMETPDEALELMTYALDRQNPGTIILERDNDVRKFDEILSDVRRVRKALKKSGEAKDIEQPIVAGAPN